jgi:hypothetical protein
LPQHENKENDYAVLDDIPNSNVLVVPHAPQKQQQQIPQTSVNVR